MDPVASRRLSRRISIADLLAFSALIDSMRFLMRTGAVFALCPGKILTLILVIGRRWTGLPFVRTERCGLDKAIDRHIIHHHLML